MRESILQDWVQELGLRHQGVLLCAIRGCDTLPKGDASKMFVRSYRCLILNAFVRDHKKSVSFFESVDRVTLVKRFEAFRRDLDHYPHHYVMHLMHAIEIIGYHYPDEEERQVWHAFYLALCKGLHVNPETKEQLDRRLGADEASFGLLDKESVKSILTG